MSINSNSFQCDLDVERNAHFFLYCPFFINQRCTLLSTVNDIDISLTNNNDSIFNHILFGKAALYVSANTSIFNATMNYIISANGFEEICLCIYLSIYLSLYLSIYLSIYKFIFIFHMLCSYIDIALILLCIGLTWRSLVLHLRSYVRKGLDMISLQYGIFLCKNFISSLYLL